MMQIRIAALGKQYKATGEILRHIDLTVEPSEFLCLLGPSGCGKSTLLRLIAGLDQPTSGSIDLVSSTAEQPRRAMSVVFQDPRLLPWRRTEANIRLPLELRHWPKQERNARVDRVLSMVGLDRNRRTYPSQLSGGMRMRVSLARALVTSPELLLLDEPFGALDEITRQALNDELLRLWQQERWTTVFVTHNLFEAVFLAQRIVIMGHHPGVIQHECRVPFPYPRAPELRTTPAFGNLVADVMRHLERVSQ